MDGDDLRKFFDCLGLGGLLRCLRLGEGLGFLGCFVGVLGSFFQMGHIIYSGLYLPGGRVSLQFPFPCLKARLTFVFASFIASFMKPYI